MIINGFNEVFKHKLKRIKEKLSVLLKSTDKKNKRHQIKALLQEAKALKNTLKKFEHEDHQSCPKCGHVFKLD